MSAVARRGSGAQMDASRARWRPRRTVAPPLGADADSRGLVSRVLVPTASTEDRVLYHVVIVLLVALALAQIASIATSV
jgi:ABC-type antimicrobial peptide transport system permease subunit